jgi:excinuclease ABC subunit A
VAECFDPATGEKVEDDTPASIWAKTSAALGGGSVLITFEVRRPEQLTWPEILQNLKGQSYVRVLVPAGRKMPEDGTEQGLGSATPATTGTLVVQRVEEVLADPGRMAGIDHLFVVQDRLAPAAENKARFLEAVEAALHFGQGQVRIFAADTLAEAGHYSRGLHSPKTGHTFRAATPALFSFNSPLGACPKCRGFGRVIEIDYRLAIPDQNLSLDDGAIKAWEGEVYRDCKRELTAAARKHGIPTHVPFAALTPEQQAFVIDGEPGYGGEGKTWPQAWYGLKGFFRWLEKNTYKMQVRIFLSRYRTYNLCPDCGGARLQPEALCWKWRGHTLPALYQLPATELLLLIADSAVRSPPSALEQHSAQLAHDSILTRLRYLEQVGVGYLTLDRASRTLSGGEVQRVNLTSCLGTSLVDTLFVLDEPSVGLHARDLGRLIAIIRSLTAAGNTVVVVEHDETMIRAADHVIELGPGPGKRGGRIMFQGPVAGLANAPDSITGRYFSGRETIAVPARRRPVIVAGLAVLHQRLQAQRRTALLPPPARPPRGVERGERLGQIHAARSCHLPRPARPPPPARRGSRRHWRRRRGRGVGGDRPGGPVAAVPHPALEPGALHRGLGAHPRALRRHARGAGGRVHRLEFLLQQRRRPLRPLQGSRLRAGGDAVPVGCLRPLPRLRRPPLQARGAGRHLEWDRRPRSPCDQRGRRARPLLQL